LAKYLVESAANPGNSEARQLCQNAAWLSLYSLGNVMVGLSHAIGHQLGGQCKVPHGVTSYFMLPAVMDYNRPASEERQALIAGALDVRTPNDSDYQAGSKAAEGIRQIVRKLGIKDRLRDWGIREPDLPKLAEATMHEFLLATNPREVQSAEEVPRLLRQVY